MALIIVLFVFIWMTFVNCGHMKLNSKDEYKVGHDIQVQLLEFARERCFEVMGNWSRGIYYWNGSYCPPVWDGVLCWEDVYEAGRTAHKPCPNYVDKFLKNGKAYKTCTLNGTWFTKKIGNELKPWTDFRSCRKTEQIAKNVDVLRIISNVGFSISIGTVLSAIIILQVFKNLHCDRNTIHTNLFIACLVRSVSSLVSQLLDNNETNSLCKIYMSFHNYIVMANFTWVFVEALYLHNVLTWHTFQETSGLIYIYIILGWGMPLIAILIWVTLRLVFDDTYCWEYGDSKNRLDVWILMVYPTLLLIQNLIFFIKLIIILHAKMSEQQLTATQNKFKKLARSIIVLMVVFGLYHLVFIPMDFVESVYNKTVSMKFFFEYFMNSVQGLMLSMMFCFFNSEVLKELKRKFHNHRNTRSIRSHDGIKLRDNSCRRRRQMKESLVCSEQFLTSHTNSTQPIVK